MKFFVSYLILFWIFLVSNYAQADQNNGAQFEYDLDLSFSYIDNFRNPLSASMIQPTVGPGSLGTLAKQRSLGLKKAAVGLNWEVVDQTNLFLGLRPDAGLREDGREFDSRAGDPYLSREKVELLDTYHLHVLMGEHLKIGAGVFAKLLPNQGAYQGLLDFGLTVQFVRKFAAAHVQWKLLDAVMDLPQKKNQLGWVFDFYALQGDGDRSERLVENSRSHDNALGGKDDHYGLAFQTTWLMSQFSQAGLLVGMSDNDYFETETTDEESQTVASGKRNEAYGQLYGETYMDFPILPTKLSLEYRVLKEKWKGDQLSLNPRTHQSLSMKGSTNLSTKNWLLWGGHYGKENISDDILISGYQMDVGFHQVIKNQLDLIFLISEEHRELEQDGNVSDGFQLGIEQDEVVRRFALEFSYRLAGAR